MRDLYEIVRDNNRFSVKETKREETKAELPTAVLGHAGAEVVIAAYLSDRIDEAYGYVTMPQMTSKGDEYWDEVMALTEPTILQVVEKARGYVNLT